MFVRPGAVVAWWDGHALAFGLVAAEEKRRVRLILPRGQETRVGASRIAMELTAPAGIPGDTLEERREAGERVGSVERRARERASDLEVPLLWQIVTEEPSAESARVIGTAELCELAFGGSSGEQQAALAIALLDDGVHFYRKGDGWVGRDRGAVERLQLERAQVARRETERRELFESLARAANSGSYRSSGSDAEQRYLDALERLAAHQEQAEPAARTNALEALAASGLRFDTPWEGAFRLLRRVGRFRSDDENLQPLRYALKTEFPPEVLEHAERVAAAGYDRRGRRDLLRLEPVSIDSAHTVEIDDALSIERAETGGFRVGVHIADPGAFLKPDDPTDREARARALSHYMPDLHLPMLPAAISEQAASLVEGQERPAVSFLVELDPAGEIVGYEVVLSVVRTVARLDYEQADRMIRGAGDGAEPLRALHELATVRQEARTRRGAVTILTPDVEVHVDEQGRPRLELFEADSPSRRVVTEAMILAGEIGASFCLAAGLAAIFRRQAGPQTPIEQPAGGISDPVAARRARMQLRRAGVGLTPGAHASLGLEAYVQVTSPIRRYQDLATQRQIAARLRDEPVPYDPDEMQRIAATTEQAEQQARRAERAAAHYWMLRYLGTRQGDELEALVLETAPRPVIQIVETGLEHPMNGLAGVEPGETIRVCVERVNPRAGLLVLGRVG